MKGAALAIALMAILVGVAAGNPPLPEPTQDDEFCNHLKIAGTGTIDIANSVVDKKLALEYYNVMQGDGDIEMDSTSAVSQSSGKLHGTINGSDAPLNLYDTIKLSYSGKTPLVGFKLIKSNAFYGGMGAEVSEFFSVTEMEKIQTTYFASTSPASFLKNTQKLAELAKNSQVHSVGMDSKMSFNGTWITDAKWHEIFYKDVKVHEAFTGRFDVEKTIRFHENPVPEQSSNACADIDC
jgi:hypothetical protein